MKNGSGNHHKKLRSFRRQSLWTFIIEENDTQYETAMIHRIRIGISDEGKEDLSDIW